jgi:alpha-mannosidase
MRRFLSLVLLLLGGISLYAADNLYTQLSITGLNADVVVNPGESFKTAMSGDGACLYSDDLQARGGLAQKIHGMFSDVPYTLADFSGNCALVLRSAAQDAAKGTSFGTSQALTFTTRPRAKTLWLLVTAPDGAATMKVQVTYTDGSTSDETSYEVGNWVSDSYSGTAYWQLGTINSANTISGYNYALYEKAVPVDATKNLASVTVSLGDTGSTLAVLAATSTTKEAPTSLREKKLFFISDSHLDTQWNWTVKTTIDEYVKNTLNGNFDRFGDTDDANFAFNFEGAIKYMWTKEYYPSQYLRLKSYIKSGRWNIAGASVDAGDVNIGSAESLIRNFLYGQKFYKSEFGQRGGEDIMLPDCFGFPWSLPTVAAHCGMKYFHTAKLAWNSAWLYDQLPRFARWIGTDGSELLSVLKLCPYDEHEAWRKDMSRDADMQTEIATNLSTYGLPATFRYVGTRGDRGGGLDKETADSLSKSVDATGPVSVTLNSSTSMFDQMFHMGYDKLPTINHGLPMRAHGVGGYTSRTMLKFWMRKGELLGDAAEKASVAANWLGSLPYQQTTLDNTWVRLLWHQFHDDIPGTCIPEAYVYTVNDQVLNQLDFSRTLNNAVGAIAKYINTTQCANIPLVVYNPLSIDRTDVVEATITAAADTKSVKVTDSDGREVLSQVLSNEGGQVKFIFLATVPSLGYASYNAAPSATDNTQSSTLSVTNTNLENARYKVTLNGNGDVSSIIDKSQNNKEMLSAPIRLEMLFDESLSWPSWEIHGDQLQKDPKEYVDNEGLDVEVAENGPLRAALKIKRTKNGSTFYQYVRLAAAGASDRVDFVNEVDWHTHQRLLKVAFPLTASNNVATYDLSIGADVNENSTDYVGSKDAHCEFLGHEWADVTNSDNSFGASILNDCKYGWDKQKDNEIRLTLIHSPKVGDSYAYQGEQDQGLNKFTYSFFAHSGKWGASTQWEADKLNEPMLAYETTNHAGSLGKTFGFVSVNNNNVAVKALKKSEYDDYTIIRFYELTNNGQDVEATFPSDIEAAEERNGVEEYLGPATYSGKKLTFHIDRFHPKTFAVKLAAPTAVSSSESAPQSMAATLAYDLDVMSNNSKREDADISKAYPSELVPDVLTADGIQFTMGPKTNGLKNAVKCAGQTITLPTLTNGKKVYLLAASLNNNGSAASFKVNDKDTTLRISYNGGYVGFYVNNTYQEKAYRDENTAFTATHSHDVAGKVDNSYDYLYMYKYAIPVSSAATTLTLPVNDSIYVLAVTVSDNENDDTKPVSQVVQVLKNTDTTDPYGSIKHNDKALVPDQVRASGYTNTRERPELATDGDETTKWCEADGKKVKWLEYKFKEPKVINGWYVRHAGIESDNYITRRFKLQRFTNGGWVDVDEVKGNALDVTDAVLTDSVVTTGVRLKIISGEQSDDSTKTTRIYEFKVYGHTATAAEQQTNMIISRIPDYGFGKLVARVKSYSAYTKASESPFFMLDENENTKWCDNSSTLPWVIVELSDVYTLNRFDIYDSQTKEPYNNSDAYTIGVSSDGVNFTTVVDKSGVADESIHSAVLDTPVDARYVKLQMSRGGGGAVRVYAFDIWGTLHVKSTPVPGKSVSQQKTILGCYDFQSESQTPLNLIDSLNNRADLTWNFAKGGSADPIKWFVLDLENTYDITSFRLFDSKNAGAAASNITGLKIYTSSVAPDDDQMATYKTVSGGDNWTLVADKTGLSTSVKTITLDNPVKARYVKVEIPNTYMSDNAQLTEFEVYGDIVDAINPVESNTAINVYPNPVSRGQNIHIVAPSGAYYELYGVGGQLIVKGTTANGSALISTSNMASGVYLIQVKTDNDNLQQKLVIK